jgi:S-DNA-T family DNA segregation ATPase FtsK/SpoIIIE
MVLGHGGAEKLLGKGHLAAALDNEQPPVGQQHFVLQVPFAATPDIKRLAEAAIAHWSVSSRRAF